MSAKAAAQKLTFPGAFDRLCAHLFAKGAVPGT